MESVEANLAKLNNCVYIFIQGVNRYTIMISLNNSIFYLIHFHRLWNEIQPISWSFMVSQARTIQLYFVVMHYTPRFRLNVYWWGFNLAEVFYNFLMTIKRVKNDIKFIISGDYNELKPFNDRISGHTDYANSPWLFELYDYDKI